MTTPTELMDALDEELDCILIPVSEAQAQKIKALYPIYLIRRLQEMTASGEMHAEFAKLWQVRDSSAQSLDTPTPVEITRIVDAIVRERLRIAVAEDQQKLRLDKERASLREASAKARHQRLVELVEAIANQLNTWIFILFYGCIMVAVGIHIPRAILCEHRGDLCYVMRVWGIKAAADDFPTAIRSRETTTRKHR